VREKIRSCTKYLIAGDYPRRPLYAVTREAWRAREEPAPVRISD